MPKAREEDENNTEKMQEMIEDTQEQIEASEGYMAHNHVKGEQRERMEAKNERRREAIENWREEIDEEQAK